MNRAGETFSYSPAAHVYQKKTAPTGAVFFANLAEYLQHQLSLNSIKVNRLARTIFMYDRHWPVTAS